ncbi:MAG: HoxN/HupN/NixA family nickel/cobalt transporter [Candidatus Pacebacteria bacterium]|nr:HoxN/HupN/NixA family nickel/cobalt transporter [Candidatus Paceibacterota bacterium]
MRDLNNKRPLKGLVALVLLLNLAVWAIAWVNFSDSASLLGLAVIAYSFGLRHALDADHIAAIDNATRRLMLSGKSARGVGIYFSLGHSSVVLLLSLGIAMSATMVQSHFDSLLSIGKTLGTGISILFLVTVGLANLRLAIGMWRDNRRGAEAGSTPNPRTPWYGGVFKLVRKSWHLYPLGFLFGLSFESATEIALLGISASSASAHWPVWQVMIFPLLFSAAMVLVDAADGVLMLGVYGWGNRSQSAKLYYNLAVTLVSVGVALVIAVIQVMGLIDEHYATAKWFHDTVAFVNDNFSLFGFLIIGIFALGWLVAFGLNYLRHREAKLERIE